MAAGDAIADYQLKLVYHAIAENELQAILLM
jgi:hypothetical protein